MIKISTITPCYNGTKYLRECWESLKNQSIGLENMECIFVDDCSTDGTWDMLCDIKNEAKDSVIIKRLPENMMQGGARNAGLKLAKGEYLQFLDQDDRLEKTALEELYFLAKDYDTDIIQFDYVHPFGKPKDDMFCRYDLLLDLRDDEERKKMLVSGVMVCSHHNHFYRRKFREETGSYFPEHMIYEEPLFVYPMLLEAKRIMIASKGFYNMRHHPESTTSTMMADRLEDHPRVQKMLYDFLKKKPSLMERFAYETEYYFIWTYYIETMINYGRGGKLSYETGCLMQDTLKRLYPDFRENPYIKNLPEALRHILDTADTPFSSGDEMRDIAVRCAAEFDGMG